MKRKKILLSVFLVLVLVFSFSVVVHATENENAIDGENSLSKDNLAVKSTISEFFKTQLEATKQNKYDKDIIKNNKVKKYQDTYCKFLNEWYKKCNVQIASYDFSLNLDTINYKGNECTANVSLSTNMTYTVSTDIVQKSAGNKYEFILAKDGEQWKIIDFKDLNEDNFSLDNKIKEIDVNTHNIDTITSQLISKDKPDNIPASLAMLVSPSFSRYNAVYYAHTYAADPNVCFPYFDGSDCTNFVSQCWNYAGVPSNDYWHCTFLGHTNSWTVVNDFKTYMVNNGWCYVSTNNLNVQLGDVIQFYNSNEAAWTHSAITTKIDSSHNLYYTGHSDYRYDYALSNVYPSSTYTQVRYLCVYNF